MAASHMKLWKLLIDRDLPKGGLCQLAKISPSTMAGLGKSESVDPGALLRIRNVLKVDISEIMEAVLDGPKSAKMD
jgi:DNA-binding Xre family transcriptional regulator